MSRRTPIDEPLTARQLRELVGDYADRLIVAAIMLALTIAFIVATILHHAATDRQLHRSDVCAQIALERFSGQPVPYPDYCQR